MILLLYYLVAEDRNKCGVDHPNWAESVCALDFQF